jgi:hypothetical protein
MNDCILGQQRLRKDGVKSGDRLIDALRGE